MSFCNNLMIRINRNFGFYVKLKINILHTALLSVALAVDLLLKAHKYTNFFSYSPRSIFSQLMHQTTKYILTKMLTVPHD